MRLLELLVFGLVVFLLFGLGYILINEVWVEDQGTLPKTVTSSDYTPEYYQPVPVTIGNTTTITMQYHPASYSLCFDFEGKSVCTGVNESTYRNTKQGDQYNVTYGYGRLDGRYVINKLER